jgi:hypothetical protein
MLEDLIKELNKNKETKKIEFYIKEIYNNPNIIEYLKENNISAKEMKNYLDAIIYTHGTSLHLEGKKEGELVKIKSVLDSFYVKSGYYEIFHQNH